MKTHEKPVTSTDFCVSEGHDKFEVKALKNKFPKVSSLDKHLHFFFYVDNHSRRMQKIGPSIFWHCFSKNFLPPPYINIVNNIIFRQKHGVSTKIVVGPMTSAKEPLKRFRKQF